MARLTPDSILASCSGSLGKEIVFKRYADKTVVSKYPDMSKIKASVLQMHHRKLFKEALLFAQFVNRHPELHSLYNEDLQPGESVFHKAKKEYLNRLKGME
ncbi:MAG: hypothetical protein EOO14_12785 [Chitinophagaceae bacterium]|nr:MAG: hypothetical protein EOO14_12785 [Chitinophagaceae bacterium]